MKPEMVTRTFITTKVVTLGVDEATGESRNESYTFVGKIKEDKLMSYVTKANTIEGYHPAFVVSYEYEENVYGLDKDTFLSLAVKVERPESQKKKDNKEKEN